MVLRNILAGSAIAALALAGGTALPVSFGPVAAAEAAVNVSIGVFYTSLGRYGDWVNYRGDYVFIPGDVDDNWRPYTRGHWVYARHYGWTWVSDEPFGWATYHYGRWGYAEDIGWYWVPGHRWAPAWVSWRRSTDYVVWAPLPPRHGGGVDVSISISVNDIPDYYWVAVPTRRFLEPDLQVVIVNSDRDVIRQTRWLGTPHITNNIVVNNVIDVNVISRETGHKVQPVEVKTTNDPTEARATGNQVTAFEGEIKTDTSARPEKLSDVGQVKKIRRKGGMDVGQPATGTGTNANAPAAATDTGTTVQPDTQAQDQQTGKKRKKLPPADVRQQDTRQSDSQQEPLKHKKQQKDAGQQDNQQMDSQQTDTQQPQGKRKKLPVQTQGQDNTNDMTGSTTPGNGKGKRKAQDNNQPVDQNAAENPGKGKGKGKGKNKQEPCDPNNPDCQPAQ